jgi:hypothetical protein
VAAEAAAVTGNERQRRRRPLHKAGAAKRAAVTESGRPLQATVTGSGRYRRPLQKAGGGDVSGRHRKRAAVAGDRHRKRTKRPLQAAVTGSGRRRCQQPLHEQCPEAGCLNTGAALPVFVLSVLGGFFRS